MSIESRARDVNAIANEIEASFAEDRGDEYSAALRVSAYLLRALCEHRHSWCQTTVNGAWACANCGKAYGATSLDVPLEGHCGQ